MEFVFLTNALPPTTDALDLPADDQAIDDDVPQTMSTPDLAVQQ